MRAQRSRHLRHTHIDVVVVGGVNMDYLVQGQALPAPGETVDGSRFLRAGGGKGANQAVAAARLGAQVAFVGRVGRDSLGDELLDLLHAERIDTRFVVRDREAPTGVALVMVDKTGEKQIMVAPGANQRVTPSDVQRVQGLISRAGVLLTQFEIPMEAVCAAARLASDAGVPIVLDPAPARSAPKELIRRVAVMRPNSTEARALTGIEVSDLPSARKAARKLLDLGAGAVAMQAGDSGDVLVWGSGEECFPQLPVKTVDATGAGDAFAAGLAVALAEKRSLREAGALANAAAALATTKFGAQPAMPRRGDVVRLMRRCGYAAEATTFARHTVLSGSKELS
ncbi:MAG: ribokinase [Verrucomicrobia subdivision 3 bacterium]|nr:ribokinase [Limisphaerales bacterium]